MEVLYKLLSDAQASLFVLFQKTWIYHWDVVGPNFQQLHTLFGEQYNTMFEEIDTLTEHMRYLGMKPVSGLSRVLEVSTIAEADSQKQYATSNLVQTIMENHGKFVWMLRSFFEE